MPRIRTVKPEFFTHPEVVPCSIPARLLLISLFTQADDKGRLYDQPRKIGGLAFADTDRVKVDKLLESLVRNERLCSYNAGGKACFHVLNFLEHQTISKPTPSRIPPCPLHDSSESPPGILPEPSGAHAYPQEVEVEVEQGKEVPATQGAAAPLPLKLQSPKVNGQPRPDQVMFSVVAEVCGWPIDNLTDDARGRVNSAARQLRSAGASEDEVRLFGVLYGEHYPDSDLTPQAISGNWTAFKGGKFYEPARRRR